MGRSFAIYVRVSEVGDREGERFGSPEEQEAAARAWAERAGEEVYFDPDECVDLDVSGGLAAEDRRLGQLIERCEAGEFAGIIVRFEDRFARDVIAGTALRRFHDCGARLIATASGFDSENITPDKMMLFNVMMSVGQAQRERNRDARMSGKERFVARGGWAGVPPFGYDKDEDGRLVPNEDAETVREIFRLRAEGVGFTDIARRIGTVSRSGVRKIVMNRSYRGEQRLPSRTGTGQPQPAKNYPGHPDLVSEPEWQAANAVKGAAPKHTGLAEATQLYGIVRCGNPDCGKRMFVLAYGKNRDRRTYACTSCGKASMSVTKVENAVIAQLDKAMLGRNKDPHVVAVLEGDTRYDDALAAVEQAQADLVAYRDSLDIQRELGPAQFAAGLKVRKEAIETARRAMRELPRPNRKKIFAKTLAEAGAVDLRDFYARVIAEVRVYPRSHGDRLTVRWQGSDEAFAVPEFKPTPIPEALAGA